MDRAPLLMVEIRFEDLPVTFDESRSGPQQRRIRMAAQDFVPAPAQSMPMLALLRKRSASWAA